MTSSVRLFAALALCFWQLSALAGARVIDIVGDADRVGAKGRTTLALFDAIEPGESVVLKAESTATLVFDATGHQFLLRGPGRWELGADTVKTSQGAPAHALPTVVLALRPLGAGRGRIAVGASAMRASGAVDLSPWPDATRLLAPPGSLGWADAGTGSSYRVVVATAQGQAVLETTQQQPVLQIPAAQSLQPGMSYAWSVDVQSGPRSGSRVYAAFTVADEATRRQWAALEPSPDAAVAQWVLFAGALEAAGYTADARAAWQRVREQRPSLRLTSPR
ncbi:MAG: hypothetical protein ABIO45_12445 [Burkholderiaceae bacterium]